MNAPIDRWKPSVKPLVSAEVGVLVDGSQARHWSYSWNMPGHEDSHIRWRIFRATDYDELFRAMGSDDTRRRLSAVVMSTGCLQTRRARDWISSQETADAFRRAINSGMGLVVMPSRIGPEDSPFVLEFLPHDCPGAFSFRTPGEVRLDDFRLSSGSLSKIFAHLQTTNDPQEIRDQHACTVVTEFTTDTPDAWRPLFHPQGKNGGRGNVQAQVHLSRRTRGRISVSDIQLDREWPQLFEALVFRAIRTSGLLICDVPPDLVLDANYGKSWLRQVPGALHASAHVDSQLQQQEHLASAESQDYFSHLVHYVKHIPAVAGDASLAHRLENGGSVTYSLLGSDSRLVVPVHGEPDYLTRARHAEDQLLAHQSDIDSTTFHLLAFALLGATARRCIRDQELVPALFTHERSQLILENTYNARISPGSGAHVDESVLPTVNLLLALLTCRDIEGDIFNMGLDLRPMLSWVDKSLESGHVAAAESKEIRRSIQLFSRFCDADRLPSVLRDFARSEDSNPGHDVPPGDRIFWLLAESELESGLPSLFLAGHTQEIEEFAYGSTTDFEARVYSFLLLMELAAAEPYGAPAHAFDGGRETTAARHEADAELISQQNGRISRLRNERDELEVEYSIALTSSRGAWGAFAVVTLALALAALLGLTLASDWDIKHDAGLYFGSFAALLVVCSILVRKMHRARRSEMVPAWMWWTIRILGFFRDPHRDRERTAEGDLS